MLMLNVEPSTSIKNLYF